MQDPHKLTDDVHLHGLPVASDPEHLGARETIEVLVSRFADAIRRGQRPSIEEYVQRHKELAAEIRELFPLIQTLEGWKSEKEVECLRRNVPVDFTVRRLGSYRIIRELGRGGMGIVFEAARKKTGQRVAVKLLPWKSEADRPRFKEQFRSEAATIARLRHPNIVQVYSFGTHDGYCYYVMELVNGASLEAVLRALRATVEPVSIVRLSQVDAPVPLKAAGNAAPAAAPAIRSPYCLTRTSYLEFANIARQVALALAHAHTRGIFHNDIKPANLLLRTNGDVVVTDFGIGRRVDDDLADGNEQVPGTLRYMAPERLRGSLDLRSDVYSLGATLYELVTQRPLYESDNRQQLVERILTARAEPVRHVSPDVPRPLQVIIDNALALNLEERYPSAESIAADLLRFMNRQPVRSLRRGIAARALRHFRRAVAAGLRLFRK